MFEHDVRGRNVSTASGRLCEFDGYLCYSAAQYLTTDGFMFSAIPVKDGGAVTELEYSAHSLLKPRAKKRTHANTVSVRHVYKLTVVNGQAKNKFTIMFKNAVSAANFLLKLKREELTAEALFGMSVETELAHPVIRTGNSVYDVEVRRA